MKIPKRKKGDDQTLLFDLEEYTTGKTEEQLVDNIFDDIEELFEDTLRKCYANDYKKNKNQHYSSSIELREFFDDGKEILKFFKKQRYHKFIPYPTFKSLSDSIF